jgi:hypothetical protein
VPDPVPLAGFTVAQVASLDAIQLQFVLLAETETVLDVPPTGADMSVDEIPYVHASAD